MSEWLVRLKGHEFDLEDLSGHFNSPKRNVRKDKDGYYYLRSSGFDPLADDAAIRERALELIEHMNGAAKIYSGESFRTVEFNGISYVDEEGQRHNFVYLSGVMEGRSRVSGSLTVVREGEVVEPPEPPRKAEMLVDLAARDARVADTLRFFQKGDWVSLYKAWEVVGDAAGGAHSIVSNGWATRVDQSRFTGTAQSREELGDEARHASEKYKSPTNPMFLSEARAFVRSVIEAWISAL
jgi:hypothetical protein